MTVEYRYRYKDTEWSDWEPARPGGAVDAVTTLLEGADTAAAVVAIKEGDGFRMQFRRAED